MRVQIQSINQSKIYIMTGVYCKYMPINAMTLEFNSIYFTATRGIAFGRRLTSSLFIAFVNSENDRILIT